MQLGMIGQRKMAARLFHVAFGALFLNMRYLLVRDRMRISRPGLGERLLM